VSYQHSKTTWSDGQSLTAANSANRWETSLQQITQDTAAHEDRLTSVEGFLTTGSPSGGTPVGYRYGATAAAGSPTLGAQQFYNTTTNELWIPGNGVWNKVALTAVSGVSGGSNAPTNFTADVQSDSSINLAWTLPTPPASQTITAVTVREKFKSPTGVSGMPLAGSATTNSRPISTAVSTREYYVTCTFSGGTESAESNHVTVYLPYGTTGGGTGGGTGGTSGTPGSILGIGTYNYFNEGVGYSGSTHRDHTLAEIVAGYVEDPYFTPNAAGDAVQFQVFANGGTTSSSTDHPRSELRELKSDGTNAAWTAGSGRNHTMIGTTTITHLPADAEASGTPKPNVTIAQIHDGKGDVVRLNVETSASSVSSLRTAVYTHSPDGAASEVHTNGSAYTIGTAINWKIESIGTTCNIYTGGTITGTPGNYTYSGGSILKSFTIGLTGGYFKAGCYVQFSTAVINAHGNPDGGYAATSYGSVELKNFQVTHSPAI
jgi:hypothetical protein